jgi:anti-sigma regulatory factor (Ser/Thr protein kinase)
VATVTPKGVQVPNCHYSQTLPGDATAPGHVRRFVQRHLATTHPSVVPDAQLLASEVVTNAVMHTTCPECVVEIEADDLIVRIAVSDCDPERTPYLAEPDPLRFGGMGMHMVNDVARCWGCDVGTGAKTVWFELRAIA